MEYSICENYKFYMTNKFNSEFLSPIIRNLLEKSENNWDDYDEVYHFCSTLAIGKGDKDFHVLESNGKCCGLAVVTRNLDELPPRFFEKNMILSDNLNQCCFLGPFHIAPEARGVGERWLRWLIDYYRQKHEYAMYVNSSHPRAFSLYARCGQEIGKYTTPSDNKIHIREGKFFKLDSI